MSFEVASKDLLGRIGRIETKSGTIETPHLFPVVNSLIRLISPREILEEFRCNALMTNAYLAKRNFGDDTIAKGIHGLLDYQGIIATDSGAYQILQYGSIESDPLEMARFQEQIGSDIAVILDVPTGWGVEKSHAEWTVKETLRRADLTLKMLTKTDILWEGPIQGGTYLDLVAASARAMSRKPFAIYSLGSPTPVMERYLFDTLVDMIMAAKENIPLSKPLHLFGAGHPIMFALAAALGCDLFDSASYALFAREERYMTATGSHSLNEIRYFPCSCPACQETTPNELLSVDKPLRERMLARHNLHVCLEEIRRIKQAISDGRLWELLEVRAKAHPSMMRAFSRLQAYAHVMEKNSPSTKSRGLLYLGSTSFFRPEIQRHRERLLSNYSPSTRRNTLVLLPQPNRRPYHTAPEIRRIMEKLPKGKCDVVIYGPPFGAIPIDIDDIYPLSQTEAFTESETQISENFMEILLEFVKSGRYGSVFLYGSAGTARHVAARLRRVCRSSGKKFVAVGGGASLWSSQSIERVVSGVLNLLES